MENWKNWKDILDRVLKENGESWGDIESNTMTKLDMKEEFDAGYGGVNWCPFTVWTKNSVYFPLCYDGAEWIGRVSRNPDGKPTEHQGG